MPEEFIIAKAQPGQQPVPGAVIRITQELPAEFEDLEEAAAFYYDQAKELEITLSDSLPGGTYDRLLVRMLAHKASHFRVAHGSVATP